mmetsp:Transcript_46037/g.152643  ORF Transcript_46037/g.152643 Transcript_46037/m.152643 type:complete len:358 (+) Transcript_46037:1000-2073(+)
MRAIDPSSRKSSQPRSPPPLCSSRLRARPSSRRTCDRSKGSSRSYSASPRHRPHTSTTACPALIGASDRTPQPGAPQVEEPETGDETGKAWSRPSGRVAGAAPSASAAPGARAGTRWPSTREKEPAGGTSRYPAASAALAQERPPLSGTRPRVRSTAAPTRAPRTAGAPAASPSGPGGSTRASGKLRAMRVACCWPKRCPARCSSPRTAAATCCAHCGMVVQPWPSQKRRASSVDETRSATAPCEPGGTMPCAGDASRVEASSTISAVSSEPCPCARDERAEARMGTSSTPPVLAPPRWSSITAAATALTPCRPVEKRTIRRQPENCDVSRIIVWSDSTSPRIRSASAPPASAPPRL